MEFHSHQKRPSLSRQNLVLWVFFHHRMAQKKKLFPQDLQEGEMDEWTRTLTTGSKPQSVIPFWHNWCSRVHKGEQLQEKTGHRLTETKRNGP